MFSNQKKSFFKSKWFYGMIAAFLLAFGIWINYDDESQNANTATKVEQEAPSTTQSPAEVNTGDKDAEEETTDKTEESGSSEETQETYYLVREVEGIVKVFRCNEKGEEQLYQITSIPFQLLSKDDQQLFIEGVHIKTLDELAGFLENFDS
ncbi:MAG: hypothetical protein PHG58_06610 [Clostridia bacterium]|nr:hypothetical protein [Clostridia bacterium]